MTVHANSQNEGGLIVLQITPVSLITKNISNIIKVILFGLIGSIFVAWFFAFGSSRLFSNRINAVAEYFTKVKDGDFSHRIPKYRAMDEITEMSDSFNRMCEDLQKYIEKVYVSELKQMNTELKLKSTELKTLQAQINPHFLYNTLEMIRMKANMDGSRHAGDMIMILSKLLRNSIKGRSIVSIEEELQTARLFLRLYQFKYANLRMEFAIDTELSRYAILRSTLQPILENCIVHGYIDGQFVIRITGEAANGLIRIAITDNGIGMEPERLNQLRLTLATLSSDDHQEIGLSNVNERLHLVFGAHSRLSVTSEIGVGTTVHIELPAKTIEELASYV